MGAKISGVPHLIPHKIQINGNAAGDIQLRVRGATGQTANIFEAQNSAGTSLFTVEPDGDVTIAGSLTASVNETITGDLSLTGNLTVNGNTILGNASSDTLSINATSTFTANATFGGSNVIFNSTTVTVNNALSVSGETTLSGRVTLGDGIRVSDGTAAIPSISFRLDTDTGLYLSASNTVGMSSGGSVSATFALSGTTAIWTGGGTSLVLTGPSGGDIRLSVAGGNNFLLASGSFCTISQNWTKSGAATYILFNDDVSADFGTGNTSSLMWETADANANMLVLSLPTGGATDVPVFAIGDATAKTADLGFFNGVTAPTLAILSDDILSFVRFSHNQTNAVYNTNEGGHTFTQSAIATGTTIAMSVTGAAHTNMTLSTEVIGVNFNLSATKEWATGALTTQREVLIQAPNYAFVGASTITSAMTFVISGGPTAGTNATITSSMAQAITTWDSDATNAIGLLVSPPGIENGVAAVTSISGVQIGSNTTIGLGNQTATLTQLAALNIGTTTYDSDDTLTRTVTIAAGAIINAPSSGTAMTMTGVSALRVGAAATHVSAAGFTYSGVNVLAHTLTLTGTVQVTGTPSVTAASFGAITITDSSAVTVDSAATIYIGGPPVAGGSVTLTTARSLWVASGTSSFGGTIAPVTAAGSDLGTSTIGWNDLHLDEGGVINFDGGDVTITHSTNVLAFAGAATNYTFDGEIEINQAAALPILDANYTATTYLSAVGIVDIVRSGALTGVNTQTIVDLRIVPSFTLTEPGSGSVNLFGAQIDMSGVAVTAGAGASVIACLSLLGNSDADTGTARAILLGGTSAANGIQFGSTGAPILYNQSAELMRLMDSTNARGLTFTLTSGGVQTVGTTAGNLTLSPASANVATAANVDVDMSAGGRLFGGGLQGNSQALAANTNLTLDENDCQVLVTLGSTSDNTITLPAASGNEGMMIHVYVTDGAGTNNAVVTRAGSDTIANGSGDLGNTTVTLQDTGDFVMLMCVNNAGTGDEWNIVAQSGVAVA